MRVFLIGLALAVSANAFADLYSRQFGPKGTLMISRPTFQWMVWAGGNTRINSVNCTLDGEPISASYDPDERRILARPPGRLKAKTYQVVMTLVGTNGAKLQKDWTVTVRSDALADLPAPNQIQNDILDLVEAWRTDGKFGETRINRSMVAAAESHVRYLSTNNVTGHVEKQGTPEFVAESPYERLHAFNYVDDMSEVVQFGRFTLQESLEHLIAAPYHRQAFMHPGPVEMGGHFASDRLVILFGGSQTTATVVSPHDGEVGVPRTWSGRERPNPLRIHPAFNSQLGYPVVVTHLANTKPVRLFSAKLLNASTGAEVPTVLNHPANDDQLDNSIFLLPTKALESLTRYEVDVRFAAEDGVEMRKRWFFTTRK